MQKLTILIAATTTLHLSSTALAREPKGAPTSESENEATAKPPRDLDTELAQRRRAVEQAEEADALDERLARIASRHRRREKEAHEAGRAEEDREGEAGKKKSPFGRPRQWVFSELAGLHAGGLSGVSGIFGVEVRTSDAVRANELSLTPAGDYFVARGWSVGLAAKASWTTYSRGATGLSLPQEDESFEVSLSPRIGRSFDLGAFALWPRLGLDFASSRSSSQSTPPPGMGPIPLRPRRLQRTLGATATLDAVFPLHQNVLFSLGPELRYRHMIAVDPIASPLDDDRDGVVLGMHANIGVTF